MKTISFLSRKKQIRSPNDGRMASDACNGKLASTSSDVCKRSDLMMPTDVDGNTIYELQTPPVVGQFGAPYIEVNKGTITELRACNSTDPPNDNESLTLQHKCRDSSSLSENEPNLKENVGLYTPNYRRNGCSDRAPERLETVRSVDGCRANETKPNNIRSNKLLPSVSSRRIREKTESMDGSDGNTTRRVRKQQNDASIPQLKAKKRYARRCRVSLDDLPSRSDIVWHDNVPFLICNFPPCKKEVPFDKAPASKKFCCNSCAKRYNVYCSQRMKDYKDRQVAMGHDAYNPSRRRRKRRVSATSASTDADDDSDEQSKVARGSRRPPGGSDDGDNRQSLRRSESNMPKFSHVSKSTNYAGRSSTARRPDSPDGCSNPTSKTDASSLSSKKLNLSTCAASTGSADLRSDNRLRDNCTDNKYGSSSAAVSASRFAGFAGRCDKNVESDDDSCGSGSTLRSNSSPTNNGRESSSNIQPETDIPSSSGGIVNMGAHFGASTSEMLLNSSGAERPEVYVSIDDMITRKPLACWTKDEIALLVRYVIPDDGSGSVNSDLLTSNGLTPVGEHSVANKFLTAQIDGEAFMIMSRHQQLINDVGILLGHALKLIKKRLEILETEVNKRWMEQHNMSL